MAWPNRQDTTGDHTTATKALSPEPGRSDDIDDVGVRGGGLGDPVVVVGDNILGSG